ncbi:F0F1 ATP synthase subunit delta [Nevskia sp.]|uniref:F0F1 ATP synthase subunit delta n=1 Tax=Nevskia sp. TaxID=1929292 RepID=UPI0025D6A838|nr:F0F1 ATP synthase subunit delta [Nevskia sp.]
MAELSTLARPYAKAVFELARDTSRFGDWSNVLRGLADAVSDPAVAAAIGHPAIGKGQLSQALIDAIGSKIGADGSNLLRLLIDNGRLKLAPAIASEYEALRAEAESVIDVEITTATAIAPAQLTVLVDSITKRLSRKLNVTTKVDESLIGGAVIRAGDLVIDGSSIGELERLRQQLVA